MGIGMVDVEVISQTIYYRESELIRSSLPGLTLPVDPTPDRFIFSVSFTYVMKLSSVVQVYRFLPGHHPVPFDKPDHAPYTEQRYTGRMVFLLS